MKKFLILLISFVISFCAIISAPIYTVRAEDGVISVGELTVHFIDVGQGDACIVELPDNRTMLIDAGENKNSVKAKLDEYITTNIKNGDNVIEYFDYVILTHSDSDHIGSMAYVLGKYPAKTVYRPNQECTYKECNDHANSGEEDRNRFWGDKHGSKSTATYHNVLEAAYANSDEVIVTNPYDNSQNKITSTNDDLYEINFYSPLSSYYSDNNNYSPIIVIEYNGRKIVLTGDAEKENEKEFVEAVGAGIDPRYAVFDDTFCADVIKLGHHGSRTSSSEDYLNTVTKSDRRSGVFVIISCGEDNSYGHPHTEVLERLTKLGFSDDNILRTDLLSDIVITITQMDGQYVAVYNGISGGSGGNTSGGSGNNQPSEKPNENPSEDDIGTSFPQPLIEFDYVKLAIIIVIVLVAIIIVAKISKPKKKGKRGKRK
ncbi:MAG: MBL fold metallo-hydrolase [Clostridiales bacterium]|nr:MBL fold metallo-hydrolase [Clostridiales bacterium]